MEKSKIRSILVPFCPPLSPVQVNEIVSAVDAAVNELIAEITKPQAEAKETKEEPEQPETSKAASSEKATKQPSSKSEKKSTQKKS